MAVGVELATAYVSIVPSFRGIKKNLENGLSGGAANAAKKIEKPLVEGAKKAANKAAAAANKEFEYGMRPWVQKITSSIQGVFSRVGDGFQGLNMAKSLGANIASKDLEKLEVTTTKVSGSIRNKFGEMGLAVSNAFKSFSTSTAQTDTWGQRIFAAVGRADDAVVRFASNAGSRINSSVGGAFSSLNRNMGAAIGMSDKTAAKFGNMAKSAAGGIALTTASISALTLAAGAATVAVVGIGLAVAGINRLNTLQQANVAFEVMLGSADKAKAVMKDLTAFAQETPFPLDNIASAAKTLKAMGQDTDKLVPTLRAAGDAAAAMGTGAQGMKDISFIMGQIITKGKLEGDEIIQLAERGVNAGAILGNMLKVKSTEVGATFKKMGKSGKEAVDMLVKGIEEGTDGVNGSTAKMGGMLEKFKDTWEGRWSDMKAAFSRLGATIFEPLFVGGQATMAKMSKLMDTVGEKWKDFQKEFKESGASAAFDRLSDAIGKVVRALVPADGGFHNLADQILPAVRMTLNFVSEALEKLARWLDENQWIARALGYALVGLVIVFLLLGLAAFVIIFLLEAISVAMWALIGVITYGLYRAIVWLVENVPILLQTLWEYLKMSFWDLIDIIGEGLEFVWQLFKTALDIVSAIWETTFEILKAVVLTFFYFVTGQWDRIGDAWSNLGDRLGQIWGGVWGNIKDLAADSINFLVSLINGASGQINSLIDAINSIPGINIGSIPDIPKLASGGIATSATTAIVGEGAEPEAIIPLSKLESFVSANGVNNGETQIVINAAGADRHMLALIRSMVRTTGGGSVQKAFG
jgi:tape measure domain-containing protein